MVRDDSGGEQSDYNGDNFTVFQIQPKILKFIIPKMICNINLKFIEIL